MIKNPQLCTVLCTYSYHFSAGNCCTVEVHNVDCEVRVRVGKSQTYIQS